MFTRRQTNFGPVKVRACSVHMKPPYPYWFSCLKIYNKRARSKMKQLVWCIWWIMNMLMTPSKAVLGHWRCTEQSVYITSVMVISGWLILFWFVVWRESITKSYQRGPRTPFWSQQYTICAFIFMDWVSSGTFRVFTKIWIYNCFRGPCK